MQFVRMGVPVVFKPDGGTVQRTGHQAAILAYAVHFAHILAGDQVGQGKRLVDTPVPKRGAVIGKRATNGTFSGTDHTIGRKIPQERTVARRHPGLKVAHGIDDLAFLVENHRHVQSVDIRTHGYHVQVGRSVSRRTAIQALLVVRYRLSVDHDRSRGHVVFKVHDFRNHAIFQCHALLGGYFINIARSRSFISGGTEHEPAVTGQSRIVEIHIFLEQDYLSGLADNGIDHRRVDFTESPAALCLHCRHDHHQGRSCNCQFFQKTHLFMF